MTDVFEVEEQESAIRPRMQVTLHTIATLVIGRQVNINNNKGVDRNICIWARLIIESKYPVKVVCTMEKRGPLSIQVLKYRGL